MPYTEKLRVSETNFNELFQNVEENYISSVLNSNTELYSLLIKDWDDNLLSLCTYFEKNNFSIKKIIGEDENSYQSEFIWKLKTLLKCDNIHKFNSIFSKKFNWSIDEFNYFIEIISDVKTKIEKNKDETEWIITVKIEDNNSWINNIIKNKDWQEEDNKSIEIDKRLIEKAPDDKVQVMLNLLNNDQGLVKEMVESVKWVENVFLNTIDYLLPVINVLRKKIEDVSEADFNKSEYWMSYGEVVTLINSFESLKNNFENENEFSFDINSAIEKTCENFIKSWSVEWDNFKDTFDKLSTEVNDFSDNFDSYKIEKRNIWKKLKWMVVKILISIALFDRVNVFNKINWNTVVDYSEILDWITVSINSIPWVRISSDTFNAAKDYISKSLNNIAIQDSWYWEKWRKKIEEIQDLTDRSNENDLEMFKQIWFNPSLLEIWN